MRLATIGVREIDPACWTKRKPIGGLALADEGDHAAHGLLYGHAAPAAAACGRTGGDRRDARCLGCHPTFGIHGSNIRVTAVPCQRRGKGFVVRIENARVECRRVSGARTLRPAARLTRATGATLNVVVATSVRWTAWIEAVPAPTPRARPDSETVGIRVLEVTQVIPGLLTAWPLPSKARTVSWSVESSASWTSAGVSSSRSRVSLPTSLSPPQPPNKTASTKQAMRLHVPIGAVRPTDSTE